MCSNPALTSISSVTRNLVGLQTKTGCYQQPTLSQTSHATTKPPTSCMSVTPQHVQATPLTPLQSSPSPPPLHPPFTHTHIQPSPGRTSRRRMINATLGLILLKTDPFHFQIANPITVTPSSLACKSKRRCRPNGKRGLFIINTPCPCVKMASDRPDPGATKAGQVRRQVGEPGPLKRGVTYLRNYGCRTGCWCGFVG